MTRDAAVPARNQSLDVLRGVAALLVLFRHAPTDLRPEPNGVESVWMALHHLGWIGVDLFFVLSGFLIGGILLGELGREGRVRMLRFWIRRAFKIWPAYFAAYGSVFLLACARDAIARDYASLAKTARDAWPNALFLQNYIDCQRWPHSWSLAVEEHFYLVLPVFLAVTTLGAMLRSGRTRRATTVLGLTAALVLALALCLRLANQRAGLPSHANYYQSHLRMDTLFLGVFLAMAHREWPSLRHHARRLVLAGAGILAPVCVLLVLYPYPRHAWAATHGFTWLALGFGFLVLAAGVFPDSGAGGPRWWRPCARAMSWVGVRSYTIYLAHAILFAIPGFASARQLALRPFLPAGQPPSQFLVLADRFAFLALSIAGGVLLARLVEQPFLRLRARVCP